MFFDYLRNGYRKAVSDILAGMPETAAIAFDEIFKMVRIDLPFDESKGDMAIPCFSLSGILKRNPAAIASDILSKLNCAFDSDKRMSADLFFQRCEVAGGYLNVYLDQRKVLAAMAGMYRKDSDAVFSNDSMKGEKIMVEFSCPNTNKTLHLGHMRNDALGSCVANLLKASGAEVMKVNLVNDRGIHICKSMLAYEKFMKGKTPETEHIKSDKFVADCYVMYNNYEKDNEQEAKATISDMLRKWEDGDKEVRALWALNRKWALDGINETYRNTNISFDKTYYESELYKDGKAQVLKGLADGIFFKDETGAVMVEVDGKNKVLLRSDGTSIYLTQDIGTALKRYEDYKYTQCVYVVGNEQIDHFKTLFAVMRKLGAPFADKLYHLSYGMVNLPDGKMKSREGTVVDADDLLADLERMSLESMSDDISADKRKSVAHDVALAALNYYLLSFTPGKDMIFDKSKSIAFSGNTGPYIQYCAARISSILKKEFPEWPESACNAIPDDYESLVLPMERMLVLYLSSYQDYVRKAAASFDPSLLVSHVYGLCKIFSRYYHDVPILKADDDVRKQRLGLLVMVLGAVRNAMGIMGLPYLPEM